MINIPLRIKTDLYFYFLFFTVYGASECESIVTYSEFVLCI